MSRRFEGKVVIVSGAGSVGPGWGNGRAAAVMFAAEGAEVFGVDRSLAAMEEKPPALWMASGTPMKRPANIITQLTKSVYATEYRPPNRDVAMITTKAITVPDSTDIPSVD